MIDLERSRIFLARLEKFSDEVNRLCKQLPKDPVNFEVVSQLVRSGGSVGANYIEAIEGLSKKDFYFRIRICRKESKESGFWLNRILANNPSFNEKINPLIQEAREYVLIFSKILTNSNG